VGGRNSFNCKLDLGGEGRENGRHNVQGCIRMMNCKTGGFCDRKHKHDALERQYSGISSII
jgi:hypothetical protein